MAALKIRGTSTGLSLPGKLAIGLVFLLLVGAAYFVIFYGDVETEIGQAEDQYATLEQQLRDAEDARTRYQQDKDEIARREQLLSKQKKALPDDPEWPAFLSTVQSMATVSGVKLASWKPNDEGFEEFYARLPMELTIEGKYHQVAKFFNSIGLAERIMNVENIRMAVTRDQGAATTKKGTESPDAVDENVVVKVSCLATAFRALKPDELGRSKRKKGDKSPAAAPPPPPPPANPGGAPK